MKVLIVHPHIRQGGAEKHVAYFAFWLKKMGVDVRIATLSTDFSGMPEFVNQLNFVVPSNLSTSSIFKSDRTESILIYIKELLLLRKLVNENKSWADVVETHHFPTYWSTFDLKKPTLLVCHESYTGCFPGQIINSGVSKNLIPVQKSSMFLDITRTVRAIIDRWIVKKSISTIMVLDEDDYAIVDASYNRKASIIPPGIDFDFYKVGYGEKVLEKYALSVNSFVMLHVGELSTTKNQVASIRAAQILREKISNLKLVLVGRGPLNSELNKLVEELHLQDIVLFTGQISEEELRDWYHACQINLFPSKVQSWGMAPFEGLAAGKPLIVSRTIGSAKIIQKAEIGLLVDPTPEAIANAAYCIYSDPEQYSQMGKRGREFVGSQLSWKFITEQLLGLIHATARSEIIDAS